MKDGLVSVVVPCFNYGRFLTETIRSLQAQSYEHWECIVVDDGSTDETPQVCAELCRAESRIAYYRQENRGLSAARNAGISRACGEFIQLLDADDLIEQDKLQSQVRYLMRHPLMDIVMGPAAFFASEDPARLTPWHYRIGMKGADQPDQDEVLAALLRENIAVVHAALVRRSVFEATGYFDESLAAHEDWHFWIRCALAGKKFAFLETGQDRALVRQHRASMSRAVPLMLRSRIAVRQLIDSSLPGKYRRDNQERLAELKWRYGLDRMSRGNLREGWKFYREGFQATRYKSRALSRLLLVIPGMPAAAQLWRSSLGLRRTQ